MNNGMKMKWYGNTKWNINNNRNHNRHQNRNTKNKID